MAISEQQRQKKLAKKKKKRTLTVKKPTLSMKKAKSYANCPIHECLIPTRLFDDGIGELIVTRCAPGGNIAMSSFVMDVFCLGVKDAMFLVLPEGKYEHEIKTGMMRAGARTFEKIDLACAKKLLDGMVEYSQNLGFSPHPDYKNAKDLFGDIEADTCTVPYAYGKDGKPFYLNGPYESAADMQRIISTLTAKCGPDGFGYLYGEPDDGFF